MAEAKKIYITTSEVAKVLEVSRATVRNWILNGYLPAFQPPSPLARAKDPKRGARGVYRIRVEDFEEFLRKGQTVKKSSKS